jgi:ParB-like chromosome segregation protein Spo0J
MAWAPVIEESATAFVAPDAEIAGLEAERVDEVVLVLVDQVQVGKRLREVDPVWAEALGQVMVREGQDQPIQICRVPGDKLWTLVDGAHRIAGAKMAGIVYLKALVVSANRDDRRQREINAQLWHRGLSDPIDRAAFMAELVSLKRAQAGFVAADHRSASVAKRWKQDIADEADQTVETISTVYGFSDEIGEQLGLTGRTVRNDLLLYRRLAPSQIARLREVRHPVATNATQLRALAKLEHADQAKIVDLLVWQGASLGNAQPKSVADAIARMRGSNRAIDPEARRLSTFLATFGRMGLAEKKGALAQLAGMLPAGFHLTEGTEA